MEERQQAQEENLKQLKDHIQELSTAREEDKKIIDALRTMVADTAWGVTGKGGGRGERGEREGREG